MKKIFFLFNFFLGFYSAGLAQQKGQYSQYMVNTYIINPAFAGSKEVFNIAAIQRFQWVSIPGAPKSQTLSLNTPLGNRKVGIGVLFLKDEIGPTKTTGAMASYAYKIHLWNGKLSFGLRAGVYNFNYRWDMISFKEQGDVYNINIQENVYIPTSDFGLYFNSVDYYAGISAMHLGGKKITVINKAGMQSSPLTTHYIATAGKAFQITPDIILNPSFLVTKVENTPVDFDVNLHVQLDKKIWFGVTMKKISGFSFLAQYYISNHLKAGYCYDLGLNKIGDLSKGSHEFYLGYDIHLSKSKTISPRYL